MAYNLIIKDAAILDIQVAYLYYEQQQDGLGERFLGELNKRFEAITQHPEYYSFIDNKQVFRDVLVNNFPYVVVYAVIEAEVRVYAICSTHRHPANKYRE